jgi:hypothetical protein
VTAQHQHCAKYVITRGYSGCSASVLQHQCCTSTCLPKGIWQYVIVQVLPSVLCDACSTCLKAQWVCEPSSMHIKWVVVCLLGIVESSFGLGASVHTFQVCCVMAVCLHTHCASGACLLSVLVGACHSHKTTGCSLCCDCGAWCCLCSR